MSQTFKLLIALGAFALLTSCLDKQPAPTKSEAPEAQASKATGEDARAQHVKRVAPAPVLAHARLLS